MPLVAAKCTQCGANIEVDATREAGICPHCGTAYITEKAVNNYHYHTNINATVTQTTNVNAQTVHIHQDEINRFFVIENGTLVKYNGNLKKIKVPDGVIELGDHVFSEIDYDEVILPSTLLSIGEGAFSFDINKKRRGKVVRKIDLTACTALSKLQREALADETVPVLILPKSLQSVAEGAFAPGQVLCGEESASKLRKKIGKGYRNNTIFTRSEYSGLSCEYKDLLLGGFRRLGKTEDGYIYVVYEDGVCICGYDGEINGQTELCVPSKVEGDLVVQISLYFYRQAMGANSLILPEGITEIPDYALANLDGTNRLEYVFVPKTVTKMGKAAMAFKGSSEDGTIEFAPGCSLKEIGEANYFISGTEIINPPTLPSVLPSGEGDDRIVTVRVEKGVKAEVQVYKFDSRKAKWDHQSAEAILDPKVAYIRSGFTKVFLSLKAGEEKSVAIGNATEAYLVYGYHGCLKAVPSTGKHVTYTLKKGLFGIKIKTEISDS